MNRPTRDKRALAFYCLIFLLTFATRSSAQVYNYLPIHHFALETNPSSLAFERSGPFLRFAQHGLSGKNNFTYSHLSASMYSKRLFSGAGVVLSNVRYSDSVSYQYAGLGLGYRNILFNDMHIKVGALVKTLNVNSGTGQFGYYTYDSPQTTIENHSLQNLNWSVALSSSRDYMYISYATLNYQLGTAQEYQELFPVYRVLHAGNFARMINSHSHGELTATAINQRRPQAENDTTNRWSYYTTYLYNMNISRRSSLLIGTRAGLAENSFYHFTPTVKLYTGGRRVDRTTKCLISLAADLGYDKNTFNRQFDAQWQLQVSLEF